MKPMAIVIPSYNNRQWYRQNLASVCGTKNLRIEYTDLNGLICKTHLAVETPGVAAHRITSVAWKRSVGGIVRPSA
jgi:hypothetical protein